MKVRKMSHKSILIVVVFAVVMLLAMWRIGNLYAGPEFGEPSFKTGAEFTKLEISLEKSVYGISTYD